MQVNTNGANARSSKGHWGSSLGILEPLGLEECLGATVASRLRIIQHVMNLFREISPWS